MQKRNSAGESLLQSITGYCRASKIAESTFGRLAVNDGKFVSRLRNGSRVTPETWDKVTSYINQHGGHSPLNVDPRQMHVMGPDSIYSSQPLNDDEIPEDGSPETNFRFFDNRQKYLLFVNTCSEKEMIATRVGLELDNVHPTPPAVRVFDAGMGDGTVLTRVMREMHRRQPTMPFYITCKEISLEDVRIALSKMADRLFEHPSTALIITNLYYSEAPWLEPKNEKDKAKMVWKEVELKGSTSHEFDEQIKGLDDFLAEHWQARHSKKTGNPIYDHPVVLVIYREDFKFLLNDVLPKRGEARADFDLCIASQPYRSRVSASFKAEKVIAPMARALRPGGRVFAVHSHGDDPGMEVIRKVWPDEDPFPNGRHEIIQELKEQLGDDARQFHFNAMSDDRSIFRYFMHALPTETSGSIGTSTLFAAWNAAVYVAQIEDERLTEAMSGTEYLQATSEVLQKHGGLWFNDESYIIVRKLEQETK
jgi:SAM-dependent methyltransferase